MRAPELFISFLERCDRDIVWISLFRVRDGIHLALLVRPSRNLSMGAIAGGSIPQPKCAKKSSYRAVATRGRVVGEAEYASPIISSTFIRRQLLVGISS